MITIIHSRCTANKGVETTARKIVTATITSVKVAVATLLLTACGHGIMPDAQQHTAPNGMTYTGQTDAKGRYDGYGQLAKGDSIIYAGQWKAGQRCGWGTATDSLGRRIVGQWRADTLMRGTRWAAPNDSTAEVYNGDFNRHIVAAGHGTITDALGHQYSGQWRNDRRSGWGFALAPNKHIRVGEWKADRFLGERLNYTADRIYGIDISRFQHDVGRRRYPIHWNQVRISHLGTISKKMVTGAVDYPVSFCYIKSTEGRTIRNRYFRADYTAARRQGIPVGAYHFFSTKTSGAIQANYFLRNTIFRKGDMPPVLDLEPTHQQIKKMGGPGAMFAAVRTWMRMVERHTGTRPVLYISQMFVNRYLPMAPDLKANYNIWIARYGEYKPDVHLVYWQLCPDGRVRGITPKVDINVFNGYRSEFEDFLRKNCIP